MSVNSPLSLPVRVYRQFQSRWAALACKVLEKRAPDRPLPDFKRLLVVVPHHDDETLGCGGLIAHQAAKGGALKVVFVTDGSGSLLDHPRVSPGMLCEIRKVEVRKALEALGVQNPEIEFLDLPDGRLSTLGSEALDHVLTRLGNTFKSFNPDAVATTFRKDRHPDHEATFRFVEAALAGDPTPRALIEFPIWLFWTLGLGDLQDSVIRTFTRSNVACYRVRKEQALLCHETQVKPVEPWTRATLSPRFARRLLGTFEYYTVDDRRGA